MLNLSSVRQDLSIEYNLYHVGHIDQEKNLLENET